MSGSSKESDFVHIVVNNQTDEICLALYYVENQINMSGSSSKTKWSGNVM